jgi:hypothetical protein
MINLIDKKVILLYFYGIFGELYRIDTSFIVSFEDTAFLTGLIVSFSFVGKKLLRELLRFNKRSSSIQPPFSPHPFPFRIKIKGWKNHRDVKNRLRAIYYVLYHTECVKDLD